MRDRKWKVMEKGRKDGQTKKTETNNKWNGRKEGKIKL